MSLFIIFIIGTFVLSIQWRGYAGKARSKRTGCEKDGGRGKNGFHDNRSLWFRIG